jgi:hypothetical protein
VRSTNAGSNPKASTRFGIVHLRVRFASVPS